MAKIDIEKLAKKMGVNFKDVGIKTEKRAMQELQKKLGDTSNKRLKDIAAEFMKTTQQKADTKADKKSLVERSKQFSREITTERELPEETFDVKFGDKTVHLPVGTPKNFTEGKDFETGEEFLQPSGGTENVTGQRKTHKASLSPEGIVKQKIDVAKKKSVQGALDSLISAQAGERGIEMSDEIADRIGNSDDPDEFLKSLGTLQQGVRDSRQLDIVQDEEEKKPAGQSFLDLISRKAEGIAAANPERELKESEQKLSKSQIKLQAQIDEIDRELEETGGVN